MSSYNNDPGWTPTVDQQEGPSSYASSSGAYFRQSGTRRDSRQGNWPESPAHHNEGTSYFPPSRPISPTYNRRLQSTSAANPPLYRSASVVSQRRNQVRSASVSSARPRYQERAVTEEGDVSNPLGVSSTDDDSDDPGVGTARLPEGADEALSDAGSLDPVTLKARQSLINVEHPFGLPIWKPALYKKSRTITRNAETALHSVPSAAAERHLLPGNIFWTVFFGWWMALVCIIIGCFLYCVPRGGMHYGRLLLGLGWYLFWPFGKYVEGHLEVVGDEDEADGEGDEEDEGDTNGFAIEEEPTPDSASVDSGSGGTIRGASPPQSPGLRLPLSKHSTITPHTVFAQTETSEQTPLLSNGKTPVKVPVRIYGSTPLAPLSEERERAEQQVLSRLAFWLAFICVIAPVMLVVTLICWGFVFTIPMAKLNSALLKHLWYHPLKIQFRAAPPAVVVASPSESPVSSDPEAPTFTVKQTRLKAGQAAPSGSPQSTVLLCIYRAVGSQYYKYTIGGVNILFINLLPIVFFVILDGLVLLSIKERLERDGRRVNPFLAFIASRGLIFAFSLASVIPLSYFIGMAVASISAQSSIGMGAVINATFGSLIEIILYSIALLSGKGRLVEGSIVGSLLAGVLLMPGVSMCSGALKKKEQKFNAKSAGVTSTMLIMAIIGTLTPTLFYQTYGEVGPWFPACLIIH